MVDSFNVFHVDDVQQSTSIQPVRVEPPVVETPVVSETRLRNLVSSAPVILFMKGTPEEAKCGFSRKMVALLQENDIPFASFNILSDEGVRAGLKVLFDWPTYPQLYVNGTLIGGLDILKEMAEGGDLKGELGVVESVFRVTENTLDMRLKQLVNMAPIMLFMKGVPDEPRVCIVCTKIFYLHKFLFAHNYIVFVILCTSHYSVVSVERLWGC